MTRILITGARGQLGSDLAALRPEAVALGRDQLLVEDAAAVERAFAEHRPEVVYNCAAYNAVDRAETESEAAFAVNAAGPENLARACARTGARLVHFSTNYVFDGTLDRPYTESDEPNPLSTYGRSKRDGEVRVLEALPSALVVRGVALFGVRGSAVKGGSFPERMVRRAREGQPMRVVADQFVNPTYTADLAEAVLGLGELSGIVHLAPFDCCSWHELAVESLRLAGLGDIPVEASSTDAVGAAAPRPLHGCLLSERVPPLRSWRDGLAAYWDALSTTA